MQQWLLLQKMDGQNNQLLNSLLQVFSNVESKMLCTVKPRFWNTSWSAANIFQNRGLFQYRGPHFGRNL